MYLYKTIPIKLYETEIQFIICDDVIKEVNKIYKRNKSDFVYKESSAGVCFCLSMHCYYIIIEAKHTSINTIQHETFHCVMKLTEDRAIVEEESRAWIMGFLGQEIFNFLKSKNITL